MRKNLRRSKIFVIGVTGQLATGKSTVSAMLAGEGAAVINADLLAHRAMRRRGPCYAPIVKAFGEDILSRGEIDRARLAEIVFADAKALRKLERIIHPHVAKEMKAQIALFRRGSGERTRIIVLDVPLLFESGMDRLADLTVAVKASRTAQWERIKKAGKISRQQARARVAAQFPMTVKCQKADVIIDNGGTLANTQRQVAQLKKMLLTRIFQ